MKRSTAEDMTWIRTDELAALRAQIADLEMNELFTRNTMVVLKDTIADLELQHVGDKAIIEALNERVMELEKDLETERMKVVACGVAAQSNTQESFERNLLSNNSPYLSASYTDVLAAISREMRLRSTVATLEAKLTQLKRPPMTRELPKVAGLYQILRRLGDPIRVCEVREMNGVLRYWHSVCDAWLDLDDTGPLLWSARPIEMDPMPEGGEG